MPQTARLTPWLDHVARWQNCKRCPLCAGRTQVVHARGAIPADIVFCAEAPGISEDVLGVPLIGPAGKLLDDIVDRAGLGELKALYCNLVGCFPKEAKEEGTNEPPDEAVKACAPRLQELVRLADGKGADRVKLLVCVGGLARDWLDPKRKYGIKLHREIPQIDITHPAALLRMLPAHQGLAIQKAVVTLATAIEEIER